MPYEAVALAEDLAEDLAESADLAARQKKRRKNRRASYGSASVEVQSFGDGDTSVCW